MLRALGAQGLPFRHAQARELVDLLDGRVTVSLLVPYALRFPPVQGGGWLPPQPTQRAVRQPVPVPDAYRAVSMFVRGEVSRALSDAAAARNRGALDVRADLVAVARQTLDRLIVAQLPPVLAASGPQRQWQEMQVAQRRALLEPVLALTEQRVRAELYDAGACDGRRVGDLAAVMHLFKGLDLRPFADVLSTLSFNEGLHNDYARALLEDAGVPMSRRAWERASPELREAWSRDPSLDLDALPMHVEPLRRDDEIIALEASVDAELMVTRRVR